MAVYAPWTVVDLARHVGRIHRWVTGIVGERLAERPAFPTVDVPDDALAAWLTEGAADLVEVLAATPAATPVWTFSREDGTAGFWHQRMVLETVHHAWDADTALGRPTAVPPAQAAVGVGEALTLYAAPGLRRVELGGGDRVVVVAPDARPAWAVTLHDVGVTVTATDHAQDADATIAADPVTLWLLLTGRADLAATTVTGDRAAAAALVAATDGVPGPAG